jgi:hypothetical protein
MKGVEWWLLCVVSSDVAAVAEGRRYRREQRWGDKCCPLVGDGRAGDIGRTSRRRGGKGAMLVESKEGLIPRRGRPIL